MTGSLATIDRDRLSTLIERERAASRYALLLRVQLGTVSAWQRKQFSLASP